MDTVSLSPEGSASLLDLLKREGQAIPAPCGGKGICGKCKVSVLSGDAGPLQPGEEQLLSESERERGVRLACLAVPRAKVKVALPDASMNRLGKGAWENGFPSFAEENAPWVRKRAVQLSKPSLKDQRSELSRLTEAAGGARIPAGPRFLTELVAALREGERSVTLVETFPLEDRAEREIAAVEAGDSSARLFGCAVDIGTTTLAVYLADLASGVPFDSISRSNPQQVYGADVISRIGYVMENGAAEIAGAVRRRLAEMIAAVAERNGVDAKEIYRVTLVGNTTMLHLLAGVDPSGIAAAPFIPVFTEEMAVPASSLELQVNPAAQAHLVPGVSSYVGADITAGILSSGILDAEGTSLLVDVGTNGEIVLTHGGELWACSTAAGPAFEGAKIRWGTGGEDGAVDSFAVRDGRIEYTTIGEQPALGICGAGLVDIIAVLLRCGVIDERGRMAADREKLGEHGRKRDTEEHDEATLDLLSPRLTEVDGKPAFVVVPAAESGVEEDIVVTQKDVREVQLAKSAVAAGIATLLQSAEAAPEALERIYLAGGFGSYVRRESAGAIGLIPEELVPRTKVAGNAAGKGALFTLLSRRQRDRFKDILDRSKYIELSTSQAFQDYFMRHMYF
jgi:uncharacterized 2Fe-2S/4Fe-4S cluster protein (DUF4445 family)